MLRMYAPRGALRPNRFNPPFGQRPQKVDQVLQVAQIATALPAGVGDLLESASGLQAAPRVVQHLMVHLDFEPLNLHRSLNSLPQTPSLLSGHRNGASTS